ncbi:carboxypeptidase-like regulatory domain-containing protein, partial [bacterium]|nr:carboxypeptidase-like regulatory domain-containing protein [bacterium]
MMRTRFKPSGSAVTGLILLLGASWLLAGNTGKIAGVITDAANRQPLIGTNIQIQGTALGAATDMKGQYSILNIPPGIYTLRISMMGYKTLVIENVRVFIDLTTALNRSLEPTVLDAAETVTVVAERPLVQADMTSSLSTVGADEIEKLPVQSMADVLELQAGVIRDGGNFHIRGGRAGEVAYWVDGVATTESFSGGNAVPVEKNAVQELQVVSGTFNAEYGQAMSGIVNIITKEGGGKTVGEVNAYAGDYLSGHDVYSVLKKVNTETDPATGVTRAIEDKENPLRRFNPVLNADFTLSGPVPFAGNRMNFFFNGRYYSDESFLYGRRWFYPQGVTGDSALVPLNAYQSYSSLAKLTFRATSNLKINYSLYLNQWHKDRSGWSQSYKYNPDGIPQNGGTGQTHILAWNHVLSSNTFYEARVSRVYQDYESYVYEDPELIPHYMVNV